MKLSRRVRVLLGLLATGVVLFFLPPLPADLANPRRSVSLEITDRHGRLLRDVLSSQAGVSRWVPLSEISPALVKATIISEDRRFYYHPGIDPLAIARAAWTDLRARRIVSGGSTITQQLVRNLRPPERRTLLNKLIEAYWAVRLECHLSKAQILEDYLNRIYYGNQSYGAQAAARLYFDEPASQLSVAQAAFLAVLPRSPGKLNPYSPLALRVILRLQRRLLHQMHHCGAIDTQTLEVALQEPIHLADPPQPFFAPHFCDLVLQRFPPKPGVHRLRTTLDLHLERTVEGLLATHLKSLVEHHVTDGAVVVLDVKTGDVLALAGSGNYFGPHGEFDAAVSPRQPGSALKPFMYSLALESGMTASTILPDIDLYPNTRGQSFIPKNYDSRFHGPVRLREALACSYNVPAVRALERVGVARFLRLLHAVGFSHLTRKPEHYGLGLTLGDGAVSLLEMARAYRALARGGLYAPERMLLTQPRPSDRRVIDSRVAYIITSILCDHQARVPAFGGSCALDLPFPCAAKTGTSKGYRDNWTVGYTTRYVVGVWVGNFGGEPMVGVSGVTGAGPLFRDIMLTLNPDGAAPFQRPDGIVSRMICPASGMLVSRNCPNAMREIYRKGHAPTRTCTVHRLISIDTRTGLRAAPGCPARFRQRRLYTVFPPLYRDWMISDGIPLPPPGGRPLDAGVTPRIAFPYDGTVFQIDPVLRRQYQRVAFKAVVPEGASRLQWWLDGRVAGRTSQPTFSWPLQPGPHDLVLVAAGRRSRPVHFVVR